MPPKPPESGKQTLEELRIKMDAILSRAEPPRPPPRVDLEDLPFAVEDTPDGPLHVRTLRLGGGHRVGRAPITAARRPERDLLALLALDPALASCDPEKALYLDTETTGLGPGAGTVAFLIGLAFWDADGMIVEQLLVRQLGEEIPVLARVAERIANAGMLVTFNGKSFDWPMVTDRWHRHLLHRTSPLPTLAHYDVLHHARRKWRGTLPDCKLQTIERMICRRTRTGDIAGHLIPGAYDHYVQTGTPREMEQVLYHNVVDLVTLLDVAMRLAG